MGNAQHQDEGQTEEFVDELKPGTELMHGQYIIESFLNAGGFGITYRAKDSLDRKVVIKECFPGAFCRRSTAIVQPRSRAHQNELSSIVRLFVQEARALSKLKHPNIVGVHQVFEENNTAYMALDFVQGRDLLEMIDDQAHTMSEAQIKVILREVLGAVGFIHDQGILHRDISPDNILVDQNMRPVLIDFGAAREESANQGRVLSALRVVKDGYSPQEFYIAGSEQGPFSDLYALGASFYHLIAGETPPNSQARLAAIASGEDDPYVSLTERAKGWDNNLLTSIDKSLAVLPKQRVQSAAEWLSLMDGKSAGTAAVIPLKTPAATTSASAKPQSSTATPKSSNKTLLLAGVAAIALIAAIGVGVSGVLSSDGSDEEVVQTQPADDATARVAPNDTTGDQTVVTTEEANVEVADVEETAADVVEVDVIDTAEVTPTLQPIDDTSEIVSIEPTSAPPVAIAPPARPLARPDTFAGLPATGTGTAQADGEITPAASETQAAVEEAVDNVQAVVAETATPDFPEALATPQSELDPVTDVVLTSTPIDREVTPDLPVAIDLASLAEDTPANVSLPEVEIAAIEPGAEIQTETAEAAPTSAVEADPLVSAGQELGIFTAWTALLPNDGLFTRSANETRIFSVNGIEVNTENEFIVALRETVTPGDSAIIVARVGTGINGTDDVTEQEWTLPIVQDTVLLSGVSFRSAFERGAWVTRVTAAPAASAGDLEVGDVILGHVQSSQRIDTRRSMPSLLIDEVSQDRNDFSFAVMSENTTWVKAFSYNYSR